MAELQINLQQDRARRCDPARPPSANPQSASGVTDNSNIDNITTQIYNAIKRADRTEPDFIDVQNSWRQSVLIFSAMGRESSVGRTATAKERLE